ncbi:MAG: membrane protein insertion efficiency factor YidD [Pseudomonadota bacterium]
MCEANPDQSRPSDSNASTKPKNRNWQGKWPKTPGRVIGTSLIRFYQLTLSGFVGNGCRHLPTCSEYGYEAIARYGIFRGGWLALIRFAKCNPWGTSGIDPVPDLEKRQ